MKPGDSAALGKDNAAWYANANRISAFLHAANPHHWPLAALRKMMHHHLKLTTNEAAAELTGKFGASVRAYDMVEHEILGMADMLSTGIIAQFPGRFSQGGAALTRVPRPRTTLTATAGSSAATLPARIGRPGRPSSLRACS